MASLQFLQAAGEALVFITDGLSEMEDVDCKMYSTTRLLRDLDEVPRADAQSIVEHLVSRVFAHSGDVRQFDDVTVLALRPGSGA